MKNQELIDRAYLNSRRMCGMAMSPDFIIAHKYMLKQAQQCLVDCAEEIKRLDKVINTETGESK